MAKTTKKSSVKKDTNILQQAHITSAVSYFPYLIWAVSMYFLAENKKETLHHIKYSAIMAVVVILLMFLLNGFAAWLLTLAYWGASIYFAFKAYKGEEVKVEILDTIEEKISEKVKKNSDDV